jgi:hypothetical protein
MPIAGAIKLLSYSESMMSKGSTSVDGLPEHT